MGGCRALDNRKSTLICLICKPTGGWGTSVFICLCFVNSAYYVIESNFLTFPCKNSFHVPLPHPSPKQQLRNRRTLRSVCHPSKQLSERKQAIILQGRHLLWLLFYFASFLYIHEAMSARSTVTRLNIKVFTLQIFKFEIVR